MLGDGGKGEVALVLEPEQEPFGKSMGRWVMTAGFEKVPSSASGHRLSRGPLEASHLHHAGGHPASFASLTLKTNKKIKKLASFFFTICLSHRNS